MQASDENIEKYVFFFDFRLESWCSQRGVYNDKVFNLTDYLSSKTVNTNNDTYNFLGSNLVDMFKQHSGQDVTDRLNRILDKMDVNVRVLNMNCLNNVFYLG